MGVGFFSEVTLRCQDHHDDDDNGSAKQSARISFCLLCEERLLKKKKRNGLEAVVLAERDLLFKKETVRRVIVVFVSTRGRYGTGVSERRMREFKS